MKHFYLLLGSNIDPESNLPRAVQLLAAAGQLLAVSAVYETEPVGGPAQPAFLNAAVILGSALPASDLKRYVIAGIERELGRVRDPLDKNAPRTIDIDIAIWRDMDRDPDRLNLADRDLLRFAHVAVPLADLAPDIVPSEAGETLSAIASRLAASGQGVVRRPGIVLPLPEGGE